MRSRNKCLKRRYKRLMAAVAGAAILSTAGLPGLPVARVLAEPYPSCDNPTVMQQPDAVPSADQTAAPGAPESTPAAPTPAAAQPTAAASPIDVVTNNAGTLGFNADANITLLSQSDNSAVVRVRSAGQTFKVDLTQQNGNWDITALRGIGDATHAATYTPAGMLFSQAAAPSPAPAPAPTPTPAAPVAANANVLYQTDNYNGWQWNENAYPQDMSFGYLLQLPDKTSINGIVPDDLYNQLSTIDFGRQFVVFARLGGVSPQGIGIGISQVTQTDNNLTVTVRLNSPQPTVTTTKIAEIITLDRTTLDFTKAITLTFVDQNGTVLNTSTINPT